MFKVGDTVEYIDSKGILIITKVLNSESLEVVDEFDMIYIVNQCDVIRKGGDGVHYVPKSINEKAFKASHRESNFSHKTSVKYINTFKIRAKSKAEVDLHLHEILPDSVNLPANKSLEFQMQVFENSFAKAQAARVKEFLIIHGYGKGVLRSEIRDFLKNKGLEFMDAEYGEYGQGATRCFMR